MEKKRRARINNYLNDLKALLLDAMKKDVSSTRIKIIIQKILPFTFHFSPSVTPSWKRRTFWTSR